jgi:hypothetical protein
MMSDREHLREEVRPVSFAIAYRMLGSVSEAEDVVQEALLGMHEALEAGELIASPRAFAPDNPEDPPDRPPEPPARSGPSPTRSPPHVQVASRPRLTAGDRPKHPHRMSAVTASHALDLRAMDHGADRWTKIGLRG